MTEQELGAWVETAQEHIGNYDEVGSLCAERVVVLATEIRRLRADLEHERRNFAAVSEDAGRYVEALEKLCQCVKGQTCPACIALGRA